MKQWDIYDYPFEEEGSHPVVIISSSSRAQNPAFLALNGLFCQSLRPGAQPKPFLEVIDAADGLDNPTLVRCDVFMTLRRDLLGRFRGNVTVFRRLKIYRKILECFMFPPR